MFIRPHQYSMPAAVHQRNGRRERPASQQMTRGSWGRRTRAGDSRHRADGCPAVLLVVAAVSTLMIAAWAPSGAPRLHALVVAHSWSNGFARRAGSRLPSCLVTVPAPTAIRQSASSLGHPAVVSTSSRGEPSVIPGKHRRCAATHGDAPYQVGLVMDTAPAKHQRLATPDVAARMAEAGVLPSEGERGGAEVKV
jgi:hypothetical protein